MQFFTLLQVFILDYIVPFIFAIGLIFFIYAVIRYFIQGPGDESAREAGRIDFIKALVWFVAGLLLYGVVVGLISLVGWFTAVGVTTDSETRLQNVPNTPQQR